MFSRRVWQTIGVVTAVIVLLIALLIGFNTGFRYTRLSSRRQEALEQAEAGKEHPEDVLPEGVDTPKIANRDTPDALMVYITLGDSPRTIGETLMEMGVIDNLTLWTLMSRINGYDGQYKSGTHFITRDMNYEELMWNLTQPPESVRITFPEGLSYLELKETLTRHGVMYDEHELDRLMNTPSEFLDYELVTSIPANVEGRDWMLEGYLFPDTYDFDINASEKRIIETFLSNMERRFSKDYRERAEYLGMSTDDIITLASVIEKESSRSNERYIVSRVFYNRIEEEMKLQSCATVNYLRAKDGRPPVLVVSDEDMRLDSRYNTYLYEGLPAGPICNPSLESIRAALYPDVDHRDVFYFAALGDGSNIFAKTYEEHQKNIEDYVIPAQKRFERQQAERGGAAGGRPDTSAGVREGQPAPGARRTEVAPRTDDGRPTPVSDRGSRVPVH